jgi:hypothetical protein
MTKAQMAYGQVSYKMGSQLFYFGILLPNTGYTWTEGIATHFIFIYDFIIIGNMLLNVLLQ